MTKLLGAFSVCAVVCIYRRWFVYVLVSLGDVNKLTMLNTRDANDLARSDRFGISKHNGYHTWHERCQILIAEIKL